MGFTKDSFVKIVDTRGDYHYGFIQEVSEKGFHFLICTHEEGDSAIEYEQALGSLSADWTAMLTPTEREIVEKLSRRLSTKDIGAELNLSPNTIRSYIRALRLKLQLDNRQQLIAFAQGMNKHLKEEA